MATCSKRRVTEEDLVKDDLKKSRVEDEEGKNAEVAEEGAAQASKSEEVKTEVEEEGEEGESAEKEFLLGETLCLYNA